MKRLPLSQTLLSISGVAILCTLGTWQIQRLHWKDGMIAKLESDYAAMGNAATPAMTSSALQDMAGQEQPIAIGKVRGRFLRDDAILLGPRSSEDGRGGYHLLVPLVLEDNKILIVNTGWVDDLWKDDTQSHLAGLPQEPVTITGVLRKPDWNRFTSRNSPSNDLWFRADVNEIASVKSFDQPYPFILYASASNPPLNNVQPIEEHWLPRNKHLQYALFWYAMAAALIGVYGFYWKSRKN